MCNFFSFQKTILEIFVIKTFINAFHELKFNNRGVAQLGSAGALGALGRRFESCRPDSHNPSYRQVSQPVFFIG